MNKLIFVDVETTGTSSYKHDIWQLAAIVEIDGERKESFDSRVRPRDPVQADDKALEIGGIDRTELDKFPLSSAVHREFKDFLGRFVDPYDKRDKFFFLGYNAKFDFDFLRSFFYKAGDKFFGSWFWVPAIDVMTLAGDKLMGRRADMKDFKLMTVAEKLGIEINELNAHDAMYDIEITRKLYHAIKGARIE